MMTKIKSKKIIGRRVVLLSAVFLCVTVFITSCKKEISPIGEDVLPEGSSLGSSGIDTFSLKTYSIKVDSVISTNPQFNLLGQYNDPETGLVHASFYSQVSLSGFSPDFGDLNDIKIDSMVLAFRYSGYYGDPRNELFEVYELDNNLFQDSTYYSFSSVPIKSENLVPTANNEGSILPDPTQPSIVGSDTLDPHLRIPMDTVLARELLELASNSPSNEVFLESFKGIYVTVSPNTPAPGRGAVYYLESTAPSSKMTVYYTQGDTLQSEFDFLIGSDLVDFNSMDLDRTGTNLDAVIEDTVLGQTRFYAQAFQARAKIEFPSVSELPKDIVLHKATLELPVSYFTGNNLYPSSSVTVGAKLFEGDDQVYLLNDNVVFNQQAKAYVIDVRQYVQNIINEEVINDGIIVSPRFFNTTTERILFNGPTTTNKSKPKLNIVYTEF
jgi:hypothetical protein